MSLPARQIRAHYSPDTITVYQAYGPHIALPAIAAGRFVEPFKRDRMTWIKPSFLWTMYRSGWATKPGQEHVLAIDITRTGFESALDQACLSHYDPDAYDSADDWSRQLKTSPVRIQWDPERSLGLQPLPYRSLQVGLSGGAVHQYVDSWIVAIRNVTPSVRRIRDVVQNGDAEAATALLPVERPYPLSHRLRAKVSASPETPTGSH